MRPPHVHVPYNLVGEHLEFILQHRPNLELFFNGEMLDGLRPGDLDDLRDKLSYEPSLTLHGPFMDLSPGAVDRRVREVTIGRFHQTLDVAEALHVRAVVLHSGYEKWKYAHNVDIWLEGSMRVWPEILARARTLGTKVAIENIFEDSPENLALLMREAAPLGAGICFDTGHFNLFSRVPLEVWLQSLGPHILELHLHDNDGSSDAHRPPGEGTFDFKALFAALSDGGVIPTVEAHSPGDVLTSLDRLKDFGLGV